MSLLQLFINGDFVDSVDATKKLKLFNPHDESLICEVSQAFCDILCGFSHVTASEFFHI